MPSPPITATRMEVVGAVAAEVCVVTVGRLVVVGPLAAVVPQVERGLDRLAAAGVVVLLRRLAVLRRTPVGVHVVHGPAPVLTDAARMLGGGFDEPPRGGAGASGSWVTRRWNQKLGMRIARDEVLCGSAAERLVVLLLDRQDRGRNAEPRGTPA